MARDGRSWVRMRLSLRRTVMGVLVLAVLQLTVYYWLIVPGRRRTRTPALPRLQHLLRLPLARKNGTCDDSKCPAVKEGMLNVHLIPHSHDDVGWLKTADQYYTGEYPRTSQGEYMFIEGKQCVRCVLNTTVTELLKNPDRRFIFIEMAFFSRYWNEIDAKTRAQVKKLIERRQLEIVLGGWVMSDAAVTYYSDLVDQHTLGFDFLHSVLGPCAQSRVAWHVDQFGHSREHAAIFARMGFDALFVGRIDFQDHDVRKKTKTLEFVWETSPNIPDHGGNLFTHVTFDGYYAPRGFVMDGVKNLFVGSQAEGNVENFISIVRERAASFGTNHLLMPMGSDFGYRHAEEWFNNMDRLIQLVNQQQNSPDSGRADPGPKVNVLYSTPSCYVHHVHRAQRKWAVKRDDFHPYGIAPGAYWTGYFTSRSGQKLLVKHASSTLQACKQLGIFSQLKDAFNRTDNLRRAVAVMQHHDAITGTEKQHVSNEYNRMLSEGIHKCQSVISEAWEKLLHVPQKERGKFVFCDKLNISQCAPTEGQGQVLVLAYNPLSRAVNTWLRFPVTQHSVSVRDSVGQPVPVQLAATSEGVLKVPERDAGSSSDSEVVFPARLPPMGYTSFLLSATPGGQKPMRASHGKGDIVIENKHLKVTFDGLTGRLKEVKNLDSQRSTKISQDMAFYKGSQGGFRSSGAYVFIPERELPQRVGGKDPIQIRLYEGPLFQEVHQQFSTWASQVVRLYKDARHLELEWTVGPIPTQDSQGKEVVSYFVSDLHTEGRFYTDSNGREVLERRLNHRETWNLTVADPISGNYFPVTSRIYIQDKERDMQLTILPDRCQGGSSLHDGTLELMVHRRLLFDDGLGVGEQLDERGTDREGVIYTGKHLLFLDTIANSAVLTREMALRVHFAPTFTFRPMTPGAAADPVAGSRPGLDTMAQQGLQKSFLREALPPNVQVLSLDYTHSTNTSTSVFLLRLEHFYERKESPVLSGTATVSLKNLFSPFEVTEAEEVSLGGNFSPGTHERLKWTTGTGHTNPASIGSLDYKSVMEDPFTVTLQPMDIRTFRVFVNVPSSSSSSFFFSSS